MIQIHLSQLHYSCMGETQPALAQIPAMQRRRLSAVAKLALHSAIQSLAGTTVDYIVWASQYGDEAKTLKILADVLQDQTPSPTLFSTSVHNAVAGLYSILCQDATPSTSLCATWSEALIEAYAYLKTHAATRVLLVYYDEPLPALYQEYRDFEGFALAAVLELDNANLSFDPDHAQPELKSLDPHSMSLEEHRFKYQDALNFYQFWQQPNLTEQGGWRKC